jgi:hypothetical protein
VITPEITTEDFVKTVAAEMACGVDRAVECWLAQVDQALEDGHLSAPARMDAIRAIVQKYKRVSGKQRLGARKASLSAGLENMA